MVFFTTFQKEGDNATHPQRERSGGGMPSIERVRAGECESARESKRESERASACTIGIFIGMRKHVAESGY